ncbi:MAG: FKBP-type peptidyl-prolyl cis-trans isomerase, partial [Bacteroidota bacterium]
MKKIINSKGNGNLVNLSDEVTLNFTGYVYSKDGKKQIFESSKTNSIPATIQVGIGKFVSGLDEGISGMRVGEKATFIVPPNLGYGEKQAGKILPNTTLYYDIELVKSENPFYKSKQDNVVWIEDSIKIDWLVKNKDFPVNDQDVLLYHYTSYYKNKNGLFVEFDKTYKVNKTKVLRLGSGGSFPGIEKALTQMCKGDKATVIIPSKLNLMKNKMTFLPENADVYFDVHIEDLKPYPFLEINNSDTIKFNSGLKVLSGGIASGNDSVVKGSKVSVAFTVYYLNQNKRRVIVDCTRDNAGKMYSFVVGNGNTIKGVEDGIIGMRTGETRRLFLSPSLAYGDEGLS